MSGVPCPGPPSVFREIVVSLEKYSNHPIARSITREWKERDTLRWARIEEVKGRGMRGETREGDIYWAGSYKIAETLTPDDSHNVYIVCNNELLGWIDVHDKVRPESAAVVRWFEQQGIRTVLLSWGPRGVHVCYWPGTWVYPTCWRNKRRSRSWSR